MKSGSASSPKKEKQIKTYHTGRIHESTKLELFYKMLEKGLTNVKDIPDEDKFVILEPFNKELKPKEILRLSEEITTT